MKIKAAVVREAGGPFVIDEVELEEPRSNEVLVKIVSSGLCHTDLVARMGYLPMPHPCVLGREGRGAGHQGKARRPCGYELHILR